jgi:hypothetical protein
MHDPALGDAAPLPGAPEPDAVLTGLVRLTAGDPGGDLSCSVIARRGDDGPVTCVASDLRASVLDHVQGDCAEGPLLEASRSAEEVLVTDVATEARWPRFLPHAAEQGVHGLLSFPLPDDGVSGALTLYLFRARPFTDGELERARRCAAEVVRVLLARSSPALEVIDQAVEILVQQQRYAPADAFAELARSAHLRGTAAGRTRRSG